jgi:hypothetical protein
MAGARINHDEQVLGVDFNRGGRVCRRKLKEDDSGSQNRGPYAGLSMHDALSREAGVVDLLL